MGNEQVIRSAKRNLAQELLLTGHFDEGWRDYEERLKDDNYEYFTERCGLPWEGFGDKRKPKRLVLVAEQGFGDTLMFCRLGEKLQQDLKKPVTLFCQKALVPLLREGIRIEEVSDELEESELLEEGTLWCPLMSLAHRYNLNPREQDQKKSYLQIAEREIDKWNVKLQRRKGYKLIGLHWQGNPKHESSIYSRDRSIPFREFRTLKELENVEFVSLQKGAGSEQLDLKGDLPFARGQKEFSDSMNFLDTAAVIANCELVISADSGVVHLAGALGIKTWVALSYVPEWRWGLNGELSSWYPVYILYVYHIGFPP